MKQEKSLRFKNQNNLYHLKQQDLQFKMFFSDRQQFRVQKESQYERTTIEMSSQKVEEGSQGSNQNSNSIKKIKFFSNAQMFSPLEKDALEPKDFSTPIQIAEFSQNKNPLCSYEDNDHDSSPLIKIEFSRIKNIAQRQNEQSEDGEMKSFDHDDEHHQIEIDPIIDMMGNKIYEFNVYSKEDEFDLSPIIEDKQNQKPERHHVMNTPLKIRHNQLRSPLLDITPSMTQKKKDEQFHTKTNKKNKTSNKTATKGILGFQCEKLGLLTPRTMAESRLNRTKGNSKVLNASKIKIERFL